MKKVEAAITKNIIKLISKNTDNLKKKSLSTFKTKLQFGHTSIRNSSV